MGGVELFAIKCNPRQLTFASLDLGHWGIDQKRNMALHLRCV